MLADGHGDTRAQQANEAFGKSDVIVIHDAQHDHTKNNIRQFDRYCKFYFEDFGNDYIRSNGDGGPIPGIMVFVRYNLECGFFLQDVKNMEKYFEKI